MVVQSVAYRTCVEEVFRIFWIETKADEKGKGSKDMFSCVGHHLHAKKFLTRKRQLAKFLDCIFFLSANCDATSHHSWIHLLISDADNAFLLYLHSRESHFNGLTYNCNRLRAWKFQSLIENSTSCLCGTMSISSPKNPYYNTGSALNNIFQV